MALGVCFPILQDQDPSSPNKTRVSATAVGFPSGQAYTLHLYFPTFYARLVHPRPLIYVTLGLGFAPLRCLDILATRHCDVTWLSLAPHTAWNMHGPINAWWS